MRAAGQDSQKWAIKGGTYFDHDTHRFIVGDIEIDGERISAIKPCGTSTLARALDARRYVCTPGLVGGPIDPRRRDIEPDRLIQCGVTTAALFFAAASACIRATQRTRARLYIHLLLNEFSRARAAQCATHARLGVHEIRVFERVAAQISQHGGHLLPAIDCASVLSAHELLYAQAFAAMLRKKLVFVLSDSTQAAQAFRERFYCTETQLLAFLNLLRPDTAVWRGSQLSRRDRAILRDSGAQAIGLPTAIPDAHVDAATVLPAAALDDPTCGRIAPGMRADLCFFSTADLALQGSGSASFLRLFESGSPDAVLIAGQFVGDDLIEAAHPSGDLPAPRPLDERRGDDRHGKQAALA
jgi:cytosine/adenosine deaminase-related metal-dependent hydrolase